MFREMRRSKQIMSEADCVEILESRTAGVLALAGDDGYPYAVPLSYVYANGKIYFHGAREGHKIDAIMRNDKASFCVIDKNQIVLEEFTTYFRSVIAFGKIRIIDDETEKRKALELLAVKFSKADAEKERRETVDSSMSRVTMIELAIEHLSGKQAIELVK
jgi:nitroimidazol reductase NimA-like FMN-containing flavoprotein (pyridoxamine 5'-phosphate oxidase superfamily)